jgi:hypothetical protein
MSFACCIKQHVISLPKIRIMIKQIKIILSFICFITQIMWTYTRVRMNAINKWINWKTRATPAWYFCVWFGLDNVDVFLSFILQLVSTIKFNYFHKNSYHQCQVKQHSLWFHNSACVAAGSCWRFSELFLRSFL